MFHTSNVRVPPLVATALLVAASAGCQRWIVVPIDLNATFDVEQVSGIRAAVHADPSGSNEGYSHENTVPPNTAFKNERSIGVYLPKGVRQFTVEVDILDRSNCTFLSGSGDFDLDAPGEPRTLALSPPAKPCGDGGGGIGGSGDGGAGGGADVVTSTTDSSVEVAEAGPDHEADCGSDAAPTGTCFEPADPDAGAPDPVAAVTSNPDCDGYCANVIAACPAPYSNIEGCRSVCVTAGWRLQAAGESRTFLGCLADNAAMAAAGSLKSIKCPGADPSSRGCGTPEACHSYCTLRDRWCMDDQATREACLVACQALTNESFSCLARVMEHDVPGDRRFCSWAAIGTTCGPCGAH